MRKSSQKKKLTAAATGAIRIIAGKYRGRKLPVLTSEGLRPTTDRVKETVFNWLMPYVQHSYCLDCFSGAGSLGFEALSRGAEQVTCIELDNKAAKQLNTNAAQLHCDNIVIINRDAIDYLTNVDNYNTAFDLVFIDPPFRQGLAEKTIAALQTGWLAANAVIYLEVEQEAADIAIPDNWRLLKEKVFGQVYARLFQLT